MSKNNENDALVLAIKLAGNQAKLAEKIGVTQQAVSYWLKVGGIVPAEAAVLIERALEGKIKREQLRPDLYD